MVLFVGGLYCYKNFENYINRVFKDKNKLLLYKTCHEVGQEDINKCKIIIAYSYAIQYLYHFNLDNKKVILLMPLLNSYRFNDMMITMANNLSKQNLPFTNFGIDTYLKLIGANNKETIIKWREDTINYIKTYGEIEKTIEDIEVKDNWIIIEGLKPVCKLPRIDDYATDDNGNKIRHILNYDNHLLFLDKYLDGNE